MKRLMTVALAAMLSIGVASVSWAQAGAEGDQGTEMQQGDKAEKQPKKKKKKKRKKAKKHDAPAAETN
jgi:hypothetical protein